MKFNEAVHAHIASEFYVLLTEAFGEYGKNAFIHAVRYYAGQRGRRMAQRAIANGDPLTHLNFMRYSELIFTAYVTPHESKIAGLSPYELRITKCPWHEAFVKLGRMEAGDVYCSYLDEALCRGFNPELDFRCEQNLCTGPYCVHKVIGADYEKPPEVQARNEYKKDFGYHCAHLYQSMSEVCGAVFGSEGLAAAEKVLEMVSSEYGREMADVISRHRDTNFNVC